MNAGNVKNSLKDRIHLGSKQHEGQFDSPLEQFQVPNYWHKIEIDKIDINKNSSGTSFVSKPQKNGRIQKHTYLYVLSSQK